MEVEDPVKRFYTQARAAPAGTGWQVELDGRPIRTALGNPQIVPGRKLAQAMADEWAAQGEEIDAGRFFCRDLADYAIDVVSADREDTIAHLLGFGETDTLCYRADPGEPFHLRQKEVWDPLLSAAESRLGVRFARTCGIMHRPQPAETVSRLRERLGACDAFALAALRTMASLAASLTIALAALEPDADPQALWSAANLEEDWQAEQWGQDPAAAERRARRLADFSHAMEFAALARA